MDQVSRIPPSAELQEQFGAIDIYLFDQLLKGTFDERPRILDVGCGGGRNLPYFLKHGFEVFAIDSDPAAVSATRSVLARLAPALSPDHVQLGDIDALPWPDGRMARRVFLLAACDEHRVGTRTALAVRMDAAT